MHHTHPTRVAHRPALTPHLKTPPAAWQQFLLSFQRSRRSPCAESSRAGRPQGLRSRGRTHTSCLSQGYRFRRSGSAQRREPAERCRDGRAASGAVEWTRSCPALRPGTGHLVCTFVSFLLNTDRVTLSAL